MELDQSGTSHCDILGFHGPPCAQLAAGIAFLVNCIILLPVGVMSQVVIYRSRCGTSHSDRDDLELNTLDLGGARPNSQQATSNIHRPPEIREYQVTPAPDQGLFYERPKC